MIEFPSDTFFARATSSRSCSAAAARSPTTCSIESANREGYWIATSAPRCGRRHGRRRVRPSGRLPLRRRARRGRAGRSRRSATAASPAARHRRRRCWGRERDHTPLAGRTRRARSSRSTPRIATSLARPARLADLRLRSQRRPTAHELYAASAGCIFQVFDDGDHRPSRLHRRPRPLRHPAGLFLVIAASFCRGSALAPMGSSSGAGFGLRNATQSVADAQTGIVHVDRPPGPATMVRSRGRGSLDAIGAGPRRRALLAAGAAPPRAFAEARRDPQPGARRRRQQVVVDPR